MICVPHGLALDAVGSSSCTLRYALSWLSGLLLGSLGRRSLSGSARLIPHRRTGGGVLCLSPFVGSPSSAGAIRDVSRRTRHNEFAPVLLLGRSGTDPVPCVYERGLVLVRGRVSSGSSELDSGFGRISSVCFPSSVRAVGSALRKYVFWVGLFPRVRGNQLRRAASVARSGSIPARAGEPVLPERGKRSLTVYPRACGGTLAVRIMPIPVRGLSPRVRGNHHPRGRSPDHLGSIPARAGEP